MSPHPGLAGYRRLLRRPGAASVLLLSLVARLPVSMVPIGLVLLVRAERGSFAAAGIVAGTFAVGTAVGSPVWGRAIDARGQSRLVSVGSAVCAVLVAALALLPGTTVPLAVLAVVALFAGGALPPVTPAARAVWRSMLGEGAALRSALALDAAAVEVLFVGGPVIVGLVLARFSPAAPVLLAALLQVVGGIGYAATDAARAVRPTAVVRAVDPDRPRFEGLIGPLAVGTALAVAFGITDTALAATAREVLHDASRVGLLFTAIAGGSALGGVLFGTRHLTPSAERRALPVLLGVVTIGLLAVPLALRAGAPLLVVLLLLHLTGLCIAPSLIVVMGQVDRAAPDGRLSEAQAWLATATLVGSSAGTPVGGVVVDVLGVPASYAIGALAAGVACLLARHTRGR
ncbi:MFS transporter [Planosporangium thailandense]|uniref:MFS transporter n=1 Tax=Planosporangium thailandense TaxID=765197 RepID=A0ABX0XXS5_9ACTN|nr:MFS transporter [Planosporangium thailandense]NJC70717.1 MFS transporter [Planosporangium thailandense]